MFSCSYRWRKILGPLTNNQGAPGPLTNNVGDPNQQPGGTGPLTNNQGAPGSLTNNQGAPEPLSDKRELRGSNWQPGGP